jgi:hypothetical protein
VKVLVLEQKHSPRRHEGHEETIVFKLSVLKTSCPSCLRGE